MHWVGSRSSRPSSPERHPRDTPAVLESWKLDPSIGYGAVFLTTLLQDKGLAVGAYDGRVTASDTGIAQSIDPNSASNDPTMTAVGGVYTTM